MQVVNVPHPITIVANFELCLQPLLLVLLIGRESLAHVDVVVRTILVL